MAHYSSHMSRRYANHAPIRDVRRVWAAVTCDPRASVRELAAHLDMQYSSVAAACRMLRDAGYIAFESGARRARTVLVPFHVKELEETWTH